MDRFHDLSARLKAVGASSGLTTMGIRPLRPAIRAGINYLRRRIGTAGRGVARPDCAHRANSI